MPKVEQLETSSNADNLAISPFNRERGRVVHLPSRYNVPLDDPTPSNLREEIRRRPSRIICVRVAEGDHVSIKRLYNPPNDSSAGSEAPPHRDEDADSARYISDLENRVKSLERSNNRLKGQLERQRELRKGYQDRPRRSANPTNEARRYRGWWLTEYYSLKVLGQLVPYPENVSAIMASAHARYEAYSESLEYWETKKRLRLEASHRAEVSEMTDSGSSSDEDSVESEDEAPLFGRQSELALFLCVIGRILLQNPMFSLSPPPKPDLDVPTPEHTSEGARSGATATLVPLSSTRSAFGVIRRYSVPAGYGESQKRATPAYGPFASSSAFSLAEWYWSSTSKSYADFQSLINIFKENDFSLADATRINWKSAFHELGANRDEVNDGSRDWIHDDGWSTTRVSIDVPFHNRLKNSGVHAYEIGDFRHRSILSVMKETIQNPKRQRHFHYHPYKDCWSPRPDSQETELYGELYTSRAFREAHNELQKLPPVLIEGKTIERVVVGMMFSSDATHLSTFGPTASLWPLYLMFGNESKLRRCRPSEKLCDQIAYFLKLPDHFKDYLKVMNEGKIPTDALLAHCARELFHKQWSILLDEDLIGAMRDGVLLLCPDEESRLFFPRIFTYSADYPEKILVAGVRNNGSCPCHRCLVIKSDLGKLGAPTDWDRVIRIRNLDQQDDKVAKARSLIYEKGYAIDGEKVEEQLKQSSLTPATSAFALLTPFCFSIASALVVDLMHEFELGVWRRLYIHLIRLLVAFSDKSVTLTAELDSRGMPLQNYGFTTTTLLASLNTLQTLLGAQTRIFERETCSKIQTKELEKEAEARARREAKKGKQGTTSRKAASLGISTIKFHFLGDYVSIIRWFGTTDSYTTEIGELCHRLPKSWYKRTDKKDFVGQMAQIERRQARLLKIREDLSRAGVMTGSTRRVATAPPTGPISGPEEPESERQYSMGSNQNKRLNLSVAFRDTPGTVHQDKYLTDFLPKLKKHLLPRIVRKLEGSPPGTMAEVERMYSWVSVVLHDNSLYSHQLIRIKYTSYDIQREESVIHIGTPQCNVMLLNQAYSARSWDTEHPYVYAKVLGIFHANVLYVGTLSDGTRCLDSHRIDLLWVHWYNILQAGESRETFQLDRLTLEPLDSGSALDFLDPKDVIRGVHIVPRFSQGKNPPVS
ncbi:hypothetical protein DFP72DRAFT_1062420 [Ephemerocybe angulata]|uniref:Uncharacterized protein n=1 Tax=Ephemerocybe angulata TaxID=980116 RepID=A0A8H6I9K1_9AGAR|nr:hypothetical protein DFP72DRAFT_1062420 [Tulosesus angulatus]